MALSPASEGQHKRTDTPVKESQVEEQMSIAKSQRLLKLDNQVNIKTSSIMSQLENWCPG